MKGDLITMCTPHDFGNNLLLSFDSCGEDVRLFDLISSNIMGAKTCVSHRHVQSAGSSFFILRFEQFLICRKTQDFYLLMTERDHIFDKSTNKMSTLLSFLWGRDVNLRSQCSCLGLGYLQMSHKAV